MAGSRPANGPDASRAGGEASPARRFTPWPRLVSALLPLAAGVAAFAIGAAALQPGLALWDTGEFQIVGPVLGTAHPTGFPAYVILSWLASIALQPLGSPAFRVNLLSSILVAVSAATLAWLVATLTGRRLIGFAAALAFATTPLVWALATHADPHAFHVAALAVVIGLLLAWEKASRRIDRARADRVLVLAALAYGVALAGHLLAVLLAPGIGLFVLAVDPELYRRRRHFAAACAATALVTASLLYLELPIRALMGAPLVYDHPDTIGGFVTVTLGTQFAGTLSHPLGDFGDKAAALARIAGDQLGPIALLVPFGLIATVWRRPAYALLTVPAVGLTCWFALSYTNAQIERYYAGPALISISWVAVLAAAVVDRAASALRPREGAGSWARRAWGGILELLAAGLLVVPAAMAAPARYASVDERGDTAAQRWLDAAFATLPANSVVVSWWDYSTALWYGQLVEGRRRDIWVVDDRTRLDQGLGEPSDVIASQLGHRPVFVIRLPGDLAALRRQYALTPVPMAPGTEPLQRVVGRIQAGASQGAGG